MRYGILGPTQVRRSDGRELAVGGPRVRALLALLLLDAGKVVSVERLIDGLYGGNPPSGAGNALQSQVSRLRGLLREEERPGSPVELHPAGYRLAVDADEVDAYRFERLAAEGRRALAAGDQARAAGLLREALDLWRGPALADLGEVPFARAQAVRLEELRTAAAEDRVEAELALGGDPGLVAELEQLVATYPLRERLRGQLMRALYAAGRQAEALTVFEAARRTLAEELGTSPSAELAAVHLAVLRADPSLGPGPQGSARRALPAQLTSFVGRADEVRRVGKLLGEARLVTLTGPGGAGKTRLAVEAAGREPGEVTFVDLGPVSQGADVPMAMFGALGLRDAGLLPMPAPDRQGPPPSTTERLVAALADRRMLLVLDNCEHVVSDAARLVRRLLSACPMLRILATSREALGLTGEALWPVPPLALPPPATAPSEALAFPAVRLFADRAAAVRPDFAVDAANVGAVLRICRTLDGLPLAIELAAARLRSLPLGEVAERLDDRFRLLSRGDRTAQPRHQTLHAAVEWSWDLLDDAERTLARRLTVFAGGVTGAAAERVCGLPAGEATELLAALADKSLLEAAGEDSWRYRMLETVRAFCAERLVEAGEWERLRQAHAAYYLDLARTADGHLRSVEQLEWLARLDAEHDNLHAALRHAIDAAEVDLGLRLLAALATYWWLRGRRGEGAALAGDLLERLGPGPPAGLEEEYAVCVLYAAVGGSASPRLLARMGTAQSIAVTVEPPATQPFLTVLWALTSGPPQVDVEPIRQRYRTDPDPWIRALARFGDGYLRLVDGETAVAERDFAAALGGFRAIGERWGTATVLAELAALADWRGDRERYLALIGEALDLAGQLDSPDDMADLLSRRAASSARAGAAGNARADYERAAELARRAGMPEHLAGAHCGLGELARRRGDLAGARRLCEQALAECPRGWFAADATRAEILLALGRVATADGDAAEALARHREAFDAVGHGGFMLTADVAEGLAGVALLEGDAERAALLLGAGTVLRGASVSGDPDVARVAAAATARLGEAAYQQAYRRGAAMTHEQALALLGAPPSASGA